MHRQRFSSQRKKHSFIFFIFFLFFCFFFFFQFIEESEIPGSDKTISHWLTPLFKLQDGCLTFLPHINSPGVTGELAKVRNHQFLALRGEGAHEELKRGDRKGWCQDNTFITQIRMLQTSCRSSFVKNSSCISEHPSIKYLLRLFKILGNFPLPLA